MLVLRPWDEPGDTVAVQQLASRLWPRAPHPGGLGWEAASDQLPAATVLADRVGRVVGWAGVDRGEMIVHADPDDREATERLVLWAVEKAAGEDLSVVVFEGDDVMRSTVLHAGFVEDGAPPSELAGMFRAVTRECPQPPPGYTIRAMREGEESERVAVHRAAWRPATMPWPEGSLYSTDEKATSRFTDAHFARLRSAWLYDRDLDLVVEAPDGTLAGCCTAWWDAANGCAEIEPLGIVPEHRRKGLASALCDAVCARVARRGGSEVFINTAPNDDYPAPQRRLHG